eukprot:TRINITY_DN73345_c0_g1_i1.p1 TRINITY_DN73345_c0_g1~~TRINITY_DN73345_c0_g1_i1.p1  ORF type:complete len:277 (+),score=42.33 TRINITY_DN73345_c0_g1_i1:85-831(+)
MTSPLLTILLALVVQFASAVTLSFLGPDQRSNASSASSPVNKDPYELQADAIIKNLTDTQNQLLKSRVSAENQLKFLKEQETRLANASAPAFRALKGQLRNATHEAARAEARVLLERIQRIHHQQKATLDRSARYWEEQIAKERELRRIADAKMRLEESANAPRVLDAALAKRMVELAESEKTNLDAWVQGLGEGLRSERSALLDAAAARSAEGPDAQEKLVKLAHGAVENLADAAGITLKAETKRST